MVNAAACAAPQPPESQRFVNFTWNPGVYAGQFAVTRFNNESQSVSNTRALRKLGFSLRTGKKFHSVECRPLATLMHEAGLADATFLSLDVEGAEEQVLSTVNPAAFKLMVIEKASTRLSGGLLASGFRRLDEVPVYASTVFLRSDSVSEVSRHPGRIVPA